jgi:thioredoxin reductase
MTNNTKFDVIIIGGSYAGMSAAMALGRSLRNVLIIDAGEPCNAPTPHSHNFLTHDGKRPAEINALARKQLEAYDTVRIIADKAITAMESQGGFKIKTQSGSEFSSRKLLLATGIKDLLPEIEGYKECWGISALHCPYCHGYEVRGKQTGILGNGDSGVEFASLIRNWTNDLTILTNGPSTFTAEQKQKLEQHGIRVKEKVISRIVHDKGYMKEVLFNDDSRIPLSALYARNPFIQSTDIAAKLGCAITEDGFIQVDMFQKTSRPDVFAAGDNTTRFRTVAGAVAMGTAAGAMINKEMCDEDF